MITGVDPSLEMCCVINWAGHVGNALWHHKFPSLKISKQALKDSGLRLYEQRRLKFFGQRLISMQREVLLPWAGSRAVSVLPAPLSGRRLVALTITLGYLSPVFSDPFCKFRLFAVLRLFPEGGLYVSFSTVRWR
jgi:hypothetical protein